MGLMKLCLFLLLVVVAAAPRSSASPGSFNEWTPAYGAPEAFFGGYSPAVVAEDSRRLLFEYGYSTKFTNKKYLSYSALRRNNIPCGRRGNSYYDCRKRRRINPYRRGCAAITGCARFLD